MEVSQFTYFQQVAGFDCAPVSSELTYGLERLAIAVQGVDNVYKLNFNGREGDRRSPMETMFLQAEQEYSRFNFEFADTEMLKRHFEDAERECVSLLGAGEEKGGASRWRFRLRPVHQASHVFNRCSMRARHIRDRAAELYLAGARSGKVLRISLAGDGRRGTRGMTEDSRETRGGLREAGAEGTGRRGGRRAMLFSATGWTFNVRLGKSGREEGEGIIIMGEVLPDTGGRAADESARAMVVKSDARKRLDLVLAAQEAVLTIPLEPFAMQRLQDRLRDLVSGYGMVVRIGFTAEEAPSGGAGGGRFRILVGATFRPLPARGTDGRSTA